MTLERARWAEAQAAERGYWYPADGAEHARRRAEERTRQAWYAGLLLLDPLALPASVVELGAGPQGLTTRFPVSESAVAVEPMALALEDRARYEACGVTLIAAGAESYDGATAEEVWMTNVLQHVLDPSAVLATAVRCAARRLRCFEWVDEPRSVVHPHVVTRAQLLAPFMAGGWRIVQETRGAAATPHWTQHFVALVVEREGSA